MSKVIDGRFKTITISDRDILVMYKKGLTYSEIGDAMGVDKSTVSRKLDKLKAKTYKHYPELPPLKDCGKVNPFLLARLELAQHFSKRGELELYKGKFIRGMKDWVEIFREMNAIRKARGEDQIDNDPQWVV